MREKVTRALRCLFNLLILLGTALEGCVHFAALRVRGRNSIAESAHWLHRWCGVALQRLNIRVEAKGTFPARGLLVANHLSYLDIFVFSTLSPCVFVAKQEIRSWPLFGPMAKMAGTVFVDRSRSRDAPETNTAMLHALSAGAVVVLFPEGTSSDGSTVLPFRPALFQAAVAAGEEVSSARIRYQRENGSAANDVCYWGSMTFFPHVLRLLSKGPILAQVQFAAEARKFDDRKLAAQATQEIISAMVGS